MAISQQKSIDPLLFQWPNSKPALLASRCNQCGASSFPSTRGCMACGSEDQTVIELPTEGTLWTFTVQRFMPKEPYSSWETQETFSPYGVGYMDLPGGLKIEGRIKTDDVSSLKIGMPIKVVFYTHRTEPDGTDIINYAFEPIQ